MNLPFLSWQLAFNDIDKFISVNTPHVFQSDPCLIARAQTSFLLFLQEFREESKIVHVALSAYYGFTTSLWQGTHILSLTEMCMRLLVGWLVGWLVS